MILSKLGQLAFKYTRQLGKTSILSTKPISKSSMSLSFKPSLLQDTVQISKKESKLITDFRKYMESSGIGNNSLDIGEVDSAVKAYQVSLEKSSKFFKPKPSYINFQRFLFNNAEKLNISKEDYYEIVQQSAQEVKKSVQAKPKGLRTEFVDNADKIKMWTDVFNTQGFVNQKNTYHKFYDEKRYNEALQEYTKFVEEITGKKLLIGCKSRMNWAISALGILNKPMTYKNVDYILVSHGKGSSLVTDIKSPDTWRFSDNGQSVYEFIESNVPKGKKVLALTCEKCDFEKLGIKPEQLVDKDGVRMFGIGDTVSGCWDETNPAKLLESGVRHITGHIYGYTLEGNIPGADLYHIKNPKIVNYNLG